MIMSSNVRRSKTAARLENRKDYGKLLLGGWRGWKNKTDEEKVAFGEDVRSRRFKTFAFKISVKRFPRKKTNLLEDTDWLDRTDRDLSSFLNEVFSEDESGGGWVFTGIPFFEKTW